MARLDLSVALGALGMLLLVLLLVVQGISNGRLRVAASAAEARREALVAEIAGQRAEFEIRARQREREQHEALAGIRLIFAREMQDAQNDHDTVVAELRADNLRLRRHWQGCAATAELSAAVAAAAGADGGAELRARGAADLVRAGAQCDARIRALQSAVRTYAGGEP